MRDLRFTLVAALFLLALPAAQAQVSIAEYDVRLEIDGGTVSEHVRILFDEINASSVVFRTDEIRDLEVYDGRGELSFSYGPAPDGGFEIKVFPRGDRLLEMFFKSEKLIFTSGSTSQLFIDFSLDIPIERMHVEVLLPPGDQVSFYFPENATIGSDGKRIILSWDFEMPTSVPLSVKYEPAAKQDVVPIAALIAIVVVAVIVAYFYRRRAKHEFIVTLYEDEKLVVERLAKRKVVWQNKLEKELKFSRPKMTRVVKKLETRGWVEKERRGRTNKLTWIKGTAKERRLLAKVRKEREKRQKENTKKSKESKEKDIVKKLFEGEAKE